MDQCPGLLTLRMLLGTGLLPAGPEDRNLAERSCWAGDRCFISTKCLRVSSLFSAQDLDNILWKVGPVQVLVEAS